MIDRESGKLMVFIPQVVSEFSGLPIVRAVTTALMLAFFSAMTVGHPDHREVKLLAHFAAGTHPPKDGIWADLSHTQTARLVGDPALVIHGPAEALRFNGTTDWLLLGSLPDVAPDRLPQKEFSVAAWVTLNQTTRYGGILGIIQDNGDSEQGWSLGYNEQVFTFSLSTKGADDGDGHLSVVAGKTAIEPERWYYVAATYDGSTMKLYVNGRLEGASSEQNGDILYPANASYVLGAYLDEDETFPMDGAVFEIKTWARSLHEQEINAVVVRNANLIAWTPPITTDLEFVVRPYLQLGPLASKDSAGPQRSPMNSMTILCETNRPAVMRVDYGERQPLSLHTETRETNRISEITLDGLEPHRSYFYRVTCTDKSGRTAVSALASMQTAPPAEMPWAFAVIGDTQRNPAVTKMVADEAWALRPNLLLHCGDVVDDGHAKNQWVHDLLKPCSRLMSQVPTCPVIGNHEDNSHWYYDYFSMPTPEYFYTFSYGNAQFFMIDSNKSLAPGSEQHQWLEKELAESTATWKFTCHHHPCFSSDENDYGDHVEGEPGSDFTWGDRSAQQLVPLYEKYRVDIAWNGHIHCYERTWPIYQMTVNQSVGVRYITSGGGGGSLEQAAPQRSWFTLHFKRAHHFVYVTIHDRTIQLKAFDLEGRLFDTFELTKAAQR